MQRWLLSEKMLWLGTYTQSKELFETEKRSAHTEGHGPQHPATTKRKWGFMAHAAGASVSFAKASGDRFSWPNQMYRNAKQRRMK